MKYPYICDITLKRLTMKRLRLGLWACFCLCAATTLMGQNKVKTTAEKVTLFIDGAQVTRTKQVDIPAGNSTLIFTGLSPIWMHKVCRSAQRENSPLQQSTGNTTI